MSNDQFNNKKNSFSSNNLNNNSENSLYLNNNNYLQQLNGINDLSKFIPHTAHHFMINSSSSSVSPYNKQINQQDQEHAITNNNSFNSNSNLTVNSTNSNSMQQLNLSKQATSFISTNNCISLLLYS